MRLCAKKYPPKNLPPHITHKKGPLALLGGLLVYRKPLARRVVPKKANADDGDKKTPFVVE